MEFRQDDVSHGERKRAIGSGIDAEPFIRKLGVVCEVWRNHHHFGALVPGFDHEVAVRRASDGDVGAPHHEVAGVVPIAGLWHVGLIAEGLWGGWGEIGVPVVEGQCDTADHLQEPGAGAVGDL